jgi:membrane protease YdiL (CAAX protease family)
MATTGVLAATGYVLAWRTSARWGIVGLTPVHPRWILIAVAAAMAVFFVGERTDHLLELGIMQGFRADFAAGIRTETGLLSLLAARCLLFPVALEVYFRGVLLNYLVHRLGTEAGVGISSALFALIFFNPDLPVSMAYGLVYGLLYAILFLRAGSLWAPIAAHATVGAMIVAKLAWA